MIESLETMAGRRRPLARQGGERGFDKLAAAADSLRRVRASLVEMRSDRHESEPWLRGRRIPRLCEAGHVYRQRYHLRRGRGYHR